VLGESFLENERSIPQGLCIVLAWMPNLEDEGNVPVGSRTSGERRVMMIVGDMIKGAAWRVSHPAVPYV